MLLGPEWFRVPSRIFYSPPGDDDSGGGGGGDEEKLLTDAEIEALPDLGDAGKKALRDQRDKRKAERDRRIAAEAERDALKTAEQERDALRQQLADREEQDRQAQERAASEAGQHEQLAESRRVELEKVKGELATATEEIKNLRATTKRQAEAIETTIEAEWKELPAEVTNLYAGGDDPIVKMEWLPKARAHAESLNGSTKERKPGHRQDPDPNRPSVEDEVEALRARSGGANAW